MTAGSLYTAWVSEHVWVSGFLMWVHWDFFFFFCSFSRSRERGWGRCSDSTAEATGDCSTCYRQHNTGCSRAGDHLPLTLNLLPERGHGEHLPWPGHESQEPGFRGTGETLLNHPEIYCVVKKSDIILYISFYCFCSILSIVIDLEGKFADIHYNKD